MRALAAAPALAAAALLAAGCGTGGIAKGKADTTHGKQLFTEKCGSCHTLADAGTQGKIGPNLDDAFSGPRAQGFKESTIRNVVHGQILFAVEHPPGFIKGPNGEEQPAPGMPRDLVTGSDAEDVAAYVASVAGLAAAGGATTTTATQTTNSSPAPSPPPPTTTEGGNNGGGDLAAQGKQVFETAGLQELPHAQGRGRQRHRRAESRRCEATEGTRRRPGHEREGRDALVQGPAQPGPDPGGGRIRLLGSRQVTTTLEA